MSKNVSRWSELVELIVVRGAATRAQLQFKGTQELEKILDDSLLAEIRAEAAQAPQIVERQREIDEINRDRQRMAQEQQLFNIFRTPVGNRVALDNQANRSIIAGWAHEGEQISPAWFTKVLSEQPQLANQLSWQSADVLDPAKRRQTAAVQAAEERRVFHEFCRDNGFSEVDANFSLAKSVLGYFDQYTLAQAVQSNALQLVEAYPAELEQFQQEKIKLHNQYLLSLDLSTLRTLAREAGARGPVAPQLDETQRVRLASEGRQYETLPGSVLYKGEEELLDDHFLLHVCDTEFYRYLLQRYGSSQLTERLNNKNYFTRHRS
jgi:hypothetical protein